MRLFDSLTEAQIEKLAKRFWAKVDKKGPDDCWMWTASFEGKPGHKYGKIKLPNSRKTVRANRVAFFLANNIDPDDFVIRHHCDNPLCCNPEHLQIGTHQDNMDDKVQRRRTSRPFGVQRGTRNKNVKLTESDVRIIRERLEAGEKPHEVSGDFGVHHDTIRKIGHRKLWPHV